MSADRPKPVSWLTALPRAYSESDTSNTPRAEKGGHRPAGRAVLLALIILISSVAPVAIGSVAAAPSGMVGVPDANVHESIPSGQLDALGVTAADFRGSVMSGMHADTLQATITTVAATRGQGAACNDVLDLDPPAYCSAPRLAIQLTDDVHHDGRRVAVPAAALADALDYVPDMAYGVHEDGTEWRRPIQRSGSLVVFETRWRG